MRCFQNLILVTGLWGFCHASPAVNFSKEVETNVAKLNFLIEGDSLAKTIEMDQVRVKQLNTTNEKLAELLSKAVAVGNGTFEYLEQKLKVQKKKLAQELVSPFGDNKKTVWEYTVTEPISKEAISFSGLDAFFISTYSFYSPSAKPDRIVVIFENPFRLAAIAAAKIKKAPPAPAVKQKRVPIDAPAGPFAVSGVNGAEAIGSVVMLNGTPLSKIEARLRTPDGNGKRWLGADESLLARLQLDNVTVLREIGMPHQFLVEPMDTLAGALNRKTEVVKVYQGVKYRVRSSKAAHEITSEFGEEQASSLMIEVTNVTSGKSIRFPFLLCQLISRYGFYGGKNSPYRLAPQAIFDFFEF